MLSKHLGYLCIFTLCPCSWVATSILLLPPLCWSCAVVAGEAFVGYGGAKGDPLAYRSPQFNNATC